VGAIVIIYTIAMHIWLQKMHVNMCTVDPPGHLVNKRLKHNTSMIKEKVIW
jgi:hypothetical protein